MFIMRKMTTPAAAAALLTLFAPAWSAVCPTGTSYSCCKTLSWKLPGQVYYPDSSDYDTLMSTYWSQSAALDPWCVVAPTSTSDVAKAMKVLTGVRCPFGVRGGGHGSFDGSNSVADGVTIDLSALSATDYDENTSIASVRPGAHWQSVYDTLAPHGVAVTGGRAGTVGVGGFISGGGNSFHSASHGMACDTVTNFEVVLYNGRVVNANANENSDLWIALKGGSANFGIVTRYDMKAIPFPDSANPDIWGGNYIYDLSAGDAVIDALVDFTDNVPSDLNSSAIVYWAYIPALGGMLLNAAVENTLGTVAPPAFDGFRTIDGVVADTTKLAPMSNVTLELGAGQPSGLRNVWLTSSFDNNADIMKYAVETYTVLTETLGEVLSEDSGYNLLCMFQPLTRAIAERGLEQGGNIMGLDKYTQERGDGQMFLLTLAVKGADQEALARPYMAAYMADLEAKAKELDVHWDWQYLNYADKTQDPISSFGADAIAHMKAVSKKYDPWGVFQGLRASGFKLPQ